MHFATVTGLCRYSELPRDGLGAPTGYTGMVWSAFRPSDDPQVICLRDGVLGRQHSTALW